MPDPVVVVVSEVLNLIAKSEDFQVRRRAKGGEEGQGVTIELFDPVEEVPQRFRTRDAEAVVNRHLQ